MPRLKPVPPPESARIDSGAALGRIIRHMRMRAGLSMSEAALAVGVSKATLVRLENDVGQVRFDTLLKILDGLGVALYALPRLRGGGADLAWPQN